MRKKELRCKRRLKKKKRWPNYLLYQSLFTKVREKRIEKIDIRRRV
uniref:Uncharacterized protein n=1 Tax=viral metagenome TaxID=1070528 RepID=A0A6C0LXW6_9ZZZZ